MNRRLGLVLALFAAVFVYADPRGEFCLNDDFTQAEFARDWATSGRPRLPQWSYAAALPQAALGAALSPGSPPGNERLRWLGLALAAACVAVFFLLLGRLGLDGGAATAGALALALNPLFLALSGSFHTDVPALLFSVLMAWALVRSESERELVWLTLASAACGLALLTRQNQALAAAGAAAYLWRRGRLGPGQAAALLGPALAAAGALALLVAVQGPTWAWLWGGAWGASVDAVSRLNGCLQTLGGLLLPVALGLLSATRRLPRPRLGEGLVLLAVAAAALHGWSAEGGMPLLPNILHRRGLGVAVLNDPGMKAAGLWAWPFLWRLWDAACLLSSLVLVRFLWARLRGHAASWAMLSVSWPPYLALLFRPDHFDRYVLALLPGTAAAALACARPREFRPAVCLGACLLMGAAGAVGLKDYYAWNRARWEAGLSAVRAGIPPDAVENGFDWDGQHSAERNMAALLAAKPAREIGMWDWMALNRVRALTSFSARPPRADFVPAGRVAYETPLSRRTEYVYLYAYAPKEAP